MKVIIYVDFEDATRPWKLHEWEMSNEKWTEMLKNNVQAFQVVNPMFTNVRTNSNIIVEGMAGHKLNIKELVPLKPLSDVIAICTYAPQEPF